MNQQQLGDPREVYIPCEICGKLCHTSSCEQCKEWGDKSAYCKGCLVSCKVCDKEYCVSHLYRAIRLFESDNEDEFIHKTLCRCHHDLLMPDWTHTRWDQIDDVRDKGLIRNHELKEKILKDKRG